MESLTLYCIYSDTAVSTNGFKGVDIVPQKDNLFIWLSTILKWLVSVTVSDTAEG